jgi:hypothetical protein
LPFFNVDQPFAAQFDENQKRRNLQTDRSIRFKSKIWQGPRAEISLPELGLIAGTRGILGAGLELLVRDRLSETHRKSVGWTLFLVGALSTIPLALDAG